MPEKEVSFRNSKGEKLIGYLHTPKNNKYASGIILAHCFSCSRHVKLIREMCDFLAGDFLVLRFDFSGNGESEGKFEDATYSKEIGDWNAAAKFMASKKVKNIGALGHSMGSAVAILAGTKNSKVRALVTMGGDSSTQGIERIFSKEQLDCMKKTGKCKLKVFGKEFTMKQEFLDDAKKHSISSILKNSKKPLCIIHGEKDEIINVENARKLYFYSNEPKNISLVKNGNHMFTKPSNALPTALETAHAWFKKYLK